MSSDATKNATIVPPEAVKNAATWGSFYSNIIFPLLGVVSSLIFGVQASWVVGALFLLSVVLVYSFLLLVNSSSASTQKAVNTVLATGIPTSEARNEVADHLKRLDCRYKYLLYICIGILSLISLVVSGHWVAKWLRTRVPTEVRLESVDRFHPSVHKDLLIKAPFIEAVLGYLEEEGKSDGRPFQILLLTTQPLPHPTPAFRLTVYYEQQSSDISGYAFRRHQGDSGSNYEPVSVKYASSDKLGLIVPPCEPGDQIFIVARISLKQTKEFPDHLSDKTKTHVEPLKENQ